MEKMKKTIILALLLMSLVIVAGCGQQPTADQTAEDQAELGGDIDSEDIDSSDLNDLDDVNVDPDELF